jgi:PleD family two-component response regulator
MSFKNINKDNFISGQIESTPLSILVAEDSPTQAEQIRHILEETGYQVTQWSLRTFSLPARAIRCRSSSCSQ